MNYRQYFKNKKVTVMGLGLLGRGLGDTVFLAKQGAELIVTDLKDKKELAPSLKKLKGFQNITYVLGEHRLEDFRDRDFILKAAGVPPDSPYIAEARKNGVPIEMSASLFAKLVPEDVIIVGITGTRGKSTTTHLVHHILKTVGKRVHLGGNVEGISTLALLPKVKAGDIVVLELDSWQLQGFGESRLSPHIAVFTNFLSDHLNYYKGDMSMYFEDKANIFKFQTKEDVLIVGKQVIRYIVQLGLRSKVRGLLVEGGPLSKSWNMRLLGEHNRINAALAVEVGRILNIPEERLRKAVASFKGLPGRLELLRTIRGIKIYNDNNATTPDATIAALRTLGRKRSVVLIFGGTDKGLDMSGLVKEIGKQCKVAVLLREKGSERIKSILFKLRFVKSYEEETLKRCVRRAFASAKRGDIILFSPAFASFGKWFKNEYDRGRQFRKLVKRLK
ncbi:UDP-N-acetylmuramoylalanine--D-glutamate ligase [Candidatus Kaiserbacteria bacterium RIFCSPHIGHO2_02_FULL_50_9]|nr:MAG: UDP-N-acetylmuramoylalanine--D-glutamate ligase [Candidatus Kaiserbacteria bacterium RIFCSPHIGHO2_02_FULL_50_9]